MLIVVLSLCLSLILVAQQGCGAYVQIGHPYADGIDLWARAGLWPLPTVSCNQLAGTERKSGMLRSHSWIAATLARDAVAASPVPATAATQYAPCQRQARQAVHGALKRILRSRL